MKHSRGFASDNNSGVHPNILASMSNVNEGHQVGYGDDQFTKQAGQLFKLHFGENAATYFVFNGTGANIVGLQSVMHSYQAVICSSTAHIHVDECGAPEKFSGAKLIAIETNDGKLTPEKILPHLHGFGFEHHSQPRVISITQSTEMGTVYSIPEIETLAKLAHKHNMLLHVDGARIANAAVSLNTTFKAMLCNTGVDIVSFGGTKNGMMFGEAIVILNSDLAKNIRFYRKQASQLYSKMRYIAAQFIAYFENDLWRSNALHANQMAQKLADAVSEIQEIKITQEVQSNGVFAIVPKHIIEPLQEQYFFYPWDENKNEVRWMTSFDTTDDDIKNFVQSIKKLLRNI